MTTPTSLWAPGSLISAPDRSHKYKVLESPAGKSQHPFYKVTFLDKTTSLLCIQCCHYAWEPCEIACPEKHLLCRSCIPAYEKQGQLFTNNKHSARCLKCEPPHESDTDESSDGHTLQPYYLFRQRKEDALPTSPLQRFETKINQELVFCPNAVNGCDWNGPLGGFDSSAENTKAHSLALNHKISYQQHRLLCPWKQLECQSCHETVLYKFLDLHAKAEQKHLTRRKEGETATLDLSLFQSVVVEMSAVHPLFSGGRDNTAEEYVHLNFHRYPTHEVAHISGSELNACCW